MSKEQMSKKEFVAYTGISLFLFIAMTIASPIFVLFDWWRKGGTYAQRFREFWSWE